MRLKAFCVLYTMAMFLSSISTPALGAGNLAPVRNWRAFPSAAAASSSPELLEPLTSGRAVFWKPAGNGDAWFSLRFPRLRKVMVTFSCPMSKTAFTVTLQSSRDSTDGANGSWKEESSLVPSGRLDKFEFYTDSPWWRLSFNTKSSSLKVSDIGAYWVDVRGRKDYWLVVGASIQAQSIRQESFHRLVKERYPAYDPVVFNEAVSGWKSDDLLRALPGFLKEHPTASYVCIHIGGNNVSANRPYPGGAEDLKRDLESIIGLIKKAGKVPILSRLSFRAYKGDKPVPPEENGSGPYVTNIFDPVIREGCPEFFDNVNGHGLIDAYTWFKDHPDELSPDGVHVNPKGEESWNRLWADKAGMIIYQTKER